MGKHTSRWGTRARALAFAGMASATLGCSSTALVTIMPGVVNNSGNRTLRRELLAFGTKSLCEEMLKRGVPLRLNDGDPTIGRFYMRQCASRTLENDDLFIQFGGVGYAWSNLTKRIGFEASAGIDYEQDFRVDGGAMWVYFKPASTTAKRFDLRMVEGQSSTPLGAVLPMPNAQQFADQLGGAFLTRELERGFTVIRESDGAVSFSLGMLPPGQRPPAPFQYNGGGRLLVMNERTDVHQNQRDYAGPIEVTGDDMAIYVTMNVEGTSAVDLEIVSRIPGEAWLSTYTHEPTAGPPQGPPIFDEVVRAGSVFRRVVRVPKGQYFVVVDNTATAGQTMPSQVPGDDRAASVSLAIEVGDAP
jgi:hypothetical protein